MKRFIVKNRNYKIEDIEDILFFIWYRKWKIFVTGVAMIGMGTAILRIFSTVGVV